MVVVVLTSQADDRVCIDQPGRNDSSAQYAMPIRDAHLAGPADRSNLTFCDNDDAILKRRSIHRMNDFADHRDLRCDPLRAQQRHQSGCERDRKE